METTQGGSYSTAWPVGANHSHSATQLTVPTRGNALLVGSRWPCPPGALFRESRRVMVALAQRLNTQPPAGGNHSGVSLIASRRGQRRAHGCSPLPRAWAIATSAPLRNPSRDGCPPRVQHLPVVGLGCPRDVLNPRTPSPTGLLYFIHVLPWTCDMAVSCEGTLLCYGTEKGGG